MNEELKPCPFCNHSQLSLVKNSEFDCWFISCYQCNGSISKSDCHLPEISYDENDVDCDCIEEDAMDYYLEGKIKGLEPLIIAWNTRQPERLMPLDELQVEKLLYKTESEVGNLLSYTFIAHIICSKFGTPKVEPERGG